MEYSDLVHRSMNSKDTLRMRPMLMMPPAPPCMEYTVCGARGMSQKRLKTPMWALWVASQINSGVQGHLHRCDKQDGVHSDAWCSAAWQRRDGERLQWNCSQATALYIHDVWSRALLWL